MGSQQGPPQKVNNVDKVASRMALSSAWKAKQQFYTAKPNKRIGTIIAFLGSTYTYTSISCHGDCSIISLVKIYIRENET